MSKICKGINKAHGYNGCGKESDYRKYGLCTSCFWDWMNNNERGKIYKAKVFDKKVTKVKEKNKRKKDKERKDSIVNWKLKLQTKVNEIVRLIDVGLPCLALGYHPNQMHAGHVFAVGGNQSMRFNLHNIHRQSAQSNHSHNDDGKLREGLINEYGQEYFNFISELRKIDVLKYSNLEYKDFYIKASKVALRLKKQGKRFDLLERIKQRNLVNTELGIYNKQFSIFNLKQTK